MSKKTILHAGPPVTWARMSGPQRGAVMGGLIYEGLAKTPEEAEALAASDGSRGPVPHARRGRPPMAGGCHLAYRSGFSAQTFGNRACTINEGLGKYCVSARMTTRCSRACAG
ncbi:MAG: hypothetical protein R2881_07485 [Eubacteriales bacterium]